MNYRIAGTITTSDTTAQTWDAIYVGGQTGSSADGDVKVDMEGGGTVTFKSVPVGTTLPVRCTRVYATGTTATNLVGMRT